MSTVSSDAQAQVKLKPFGVLWGLYARLPAGVSIRRAPRGTHGWYVVHYDKSCRENGGVTHTIITERHEIVSFRRRWGRPLDYGSKTAKRVTYASRADAEAALLLVVALRPEWTGLLEPRRIPE